MSSSYSLNNPPLFNGEGYRSWEEKMKFFIEGTNRGIWKAVREGSFVPTHEVNGVVVEKYEKDWCKEDKQNVYHGLKTNNIIITTIGIDEFL